MTSSCVAPPATFESYDSYGSHYAGNGRLDYDQPYHQQQGSYGYADDYGRWVSPSLHRTTGHILIPSSTSLAAHAAPPGLSYPPPPAAAAYPPPMPHSRSNPNMADHRHLNPHTQVQRDYFQPQRTRTPDIYDVPGAMPYDEPDSIPYGYGQHQHQHQHQQGGYHRQDSYNSTSNAGHWNRRI